MVASARHEKPHIASQPASHIDSRSASASLYLTRAQGAPVSSKKPNTLLQRSLVKIECTVQSISVDQIFAYSRVKHKSLYTENILSALFIILGSV